MRDVTTPEIAALVEAWTGRKAERVEYAKAACSRFHGAHRLRLHFEGGGYQDIANAFLRRALPEPLAAVRKAIKREAADAEHSASQLREQIAELQERLTVHQREAARLRALVGGGGGEG